MLKKSLRLNKKKDFMRLAVKGRSVFGPFATLRFFASTNGSTRVAFITSTKVFKKAVDRNRAKRRMREAVRAEWAILPKAIYLLFVLKPECKEADFSLLREEIKRLMSKIPEAMNRPPKPSSRGVKYSKKLSENKRKA